MTATTKRLCFWPPFMGFLAYFFTAQAATIDWLLVGLSIFVVMLEAVHVVILFDRRIYPVLIKRAGAVTGMLALASIAILGPSIPTYVLVSVLVIISVWLGISVRNQHHSPFTSESN